MALQFHPRRGAILMCDFSAGGFQEPEMIKTRPCLVISRKGRCNVCTVVPFSGSEPHQLEKCHVEIPVGVVPGTFFTKPMWAKCDMVSTVGFFRLDRFRTHEKGQLTYKAGQISDELLAKIEDAVKFYLGLK
ncbi:MAG: type II toxin-antitoxin system PemK/MazF family toxin [Aureliella sp.]